ncbi:hypothetical protein G9C98_000758 [Cotesia typhae]|uniref:Uncharacterized protein n=1 Tax=Cotesia typhae TaxID=2053667 RepID=A0A8J5VB71_9HYME|nr:hypothetical protein G9C98_000758 [Cotesia typhae]
MLGLPILSQNIFGSSKRPKFRPRSPKFPKNSKSRRLNYKPSNKCPQIRKLLCPNCVNSLAKSQNKAPDFVEEYSEGEYQLKVDMVKNKSKRNKEFLENEETYLGSKNWGPNKQDLGLTVNLDEEEREGLERGKVRREKISLVAEMKRIEDIQIKERVYNVVTNDGVVIKLRPMKLGDPNWVLGFVENYLGFHKQVMAPYTGFKRM